MKYKLALLTVGMCITINGFTAPSLKIIPSAPTARNLFQIIVSDPSYPNGCAPTEVFSIRLRSGNRLEMVALPTGQFCTQAITSYKLSATARLDHPGSYTLDYYLGFNEPRSTSISFTVHDAGPDMSHTEGYQQGFEDGKSACLADPGECGLNINPVTYENGRLHIPEVYVIDPFNSVTRFTADFLYIPFSVPFSLEIDSAELLDEE